MGRPLGTGRAEERGGSSNRRERLRRYGLPIALAVLSLGATCENQDYFVPTRLHLDDAAVFEPAVAEIEQPYRGLNSIDFEVANTGGAPASYGLFVAVYCADDECTEKVGSRVIGPVQPGASISGRLFESELGLGELVHVEFACFSSEPDDSSRCSGQLDYVIMLRQVECRGDGDCPAGEFCDQNLGICRVSAEEDTGCRIAPEAARPGAGSSALLTLLLGGLVWRRRRRQQA